jgi:hypothetical protein
LVELAQASHHRPLISVQLGTLFPAWSEAGVLGQIVTLALPSVVAAAETGHLSVGGVVSQLIAGGAGGAILTAIIGAIKNKAMA